MTETPHRVCPECGAETNDPTCPTDGEMTLVRRPPEDALTARTGSLISGRYRVDKVVGQGGFGAVYKATHTATNDTVAIKVLRTNVQGSADVIARFRQEAKATSKLKHPNTVRVFDFGQMDDGNLFIAMEFLEGRTLTDLMRREGPLEPKRLVHIAVQVLKSLSEAHAKGIVHRDLKPDNIFLQNVHGEADFVKVLDFGIAKSMSGDTSADMTSTGAIIGTPRYMSPEQARGAAIDGRTDLYSLAIILHECLTGIAPFLADSPLSMLLRRVAEEPPRVHESLALPTPQAMCDAVLKALAREPGERFAGADEMAAALLAALDSPLVAAQSGIGLGTPARSEARTRVEVDDDAAGFTMDATLGPGAITGGEMAVLAQPTAITQPQVPAVFTVSGLSTAAISAPVATPAPVAAAEPVAPQPAAPARIPWLAVGLAAVVVILALVVVLQKSAAPPVAPAAVAVPATAPAPVVVAAPVAIPVAVPAPVAVPVPVAAPAVPAPVAVAIPVPDQPVPAVVPATPVPSRPRHVKTAADKPAGQPDPVGKVEPIEKPKKDPELLIK